MAEEFERTIAVRAGEELPIDRLAPYLRQHLGQTTGPLDVEQFPQGHSNLTYLVRLGDVELVLRRGPLGNAVKSAHDMGREYRILSRLWTIYPPAPRPVLFCDDRAVMDVPFYLMERRRGIILRGQAPPGFALDPPAVRRLSLALIDGLAELHALDYHAAGLGDLGRPEGYVGRQVAGWSERSQNAPTGDQAVLDRVAAWLAARAPRVSGAALIHNDFKYDNLVLDPDDLSRLEAVLDWEMATVGDPLMDLGTTLGYWVEAGDPPALRRFATGPTALPGSPTRRELAERYAKCAGRAVEDPLFYYVFGLFKIAVIVQQIYARYVRGATRDPRFAPLDALVNALAEQGERAIRLGRL